MPDNDKIEKCPMPGCGGECMPSDAKRAAKILHMTTGVKVYCRNIECQYQAPSIPVHNRLCKRARLGELVEKFIDYPPWDDEQTHTPMFKKIDEESFKHWYSLARSDGVQACINMLTLPVLSDSEVKDRGE